MIMRTRRLIDILNHPETAEERALADQLIARRSARILANRKIVDNERSGPAPTVRPYERRARVSRDLPE